RTHDRGDLVAGGERGRFRGGELRRRSGHILRANHPGPVTDRRRVIGIVHMLPAVRYSREKNFQARQNATGARAGSLGISNPRTKPCNELTKLSRAITGVVASCPAISSNQSVYFGFGRRESNCNTCI